MFGYRHSVASPMALTPLMVLQVLEQYMVPNIYALVANTSYGERQLMIVRLQDTTTHTWLKPGPVYTSVAQQFLRAISLPVLVHGGGCDQI